MKRIVRSLIVSIIALIICTVPRASLAAQPGLALEGLWDSQVTLTDCQGGTLAAFSAYVMFNRGGTLNSTDNLPPTMHGPGLGTWQRLGGRNYSAPFQFFNFNPDGSFAGVQKISRTITLGGGGNSFTSVVTFESFDPDGNLLFAGCGTESATRLP
ncbi:MAG TPA: hypothetical protein VFV83_03385 [Chthoniobacteraceae bacterium]|nr:hypothetical protein [Chthoniobacteraceae bacterium]